MSITGDFDERRHDHPGHGGIKSDASEHRWISADLVDVGRTVTADRNRQVGDDLSRIMSCQRFTPQSKRCRQTGGQARFLRGPQQYRGPGMRHHPGYGPIYRQRRYGDVDLLTRLVLLDHEMFGPWQVELSQVRAPFFVYDTRSA